jgi:hypothetical protein
VVEYLESSGAIILLYLTKLKKCGWCKITFDAPWIIPTGEKWPDNAKINGEVAFHWQDSHGFPVEFLVDMVNDSCFKA